MDEQSRRPRARARYADAARQVTPLESQACRVKGKVLTFRMPGIPYVEPGFATVEDTGRGPAAQQRGREAARCGWAALAALRAGWRVACWLSLS